MRVTAALASGFCFVNRRDEPAGYRQERICFANRRTLVFWTSPFPSHSDSLFHEICQWRQ